ncbi:MAG: c-type cytochrome [Wenzhouxiangellaceae bacterium]
MSEQDDKIFMKRFSLIIVGLVFFAALIIIVAIYVNSQIAGSPNPARDAATVQRVKPVFDVYAGETGRAAAQAAAKETGSGRQQQQAAFDGSTDGERIYNNVCQACHTSGAAGAPQLVAAQWEDRLEKGEDALADSAINGIGAMPPKGGRSDLSDAQVRASVEYMLGEID